MTTETAETTRKPRSVERVKGCDVPRKPEKQITLKRWAEIQNVEVKQVIGRLVMIQRVARDPAAPLPMPEWWGLPAWVVLAEKIPPRKKAPAVKCLTCLKVGGHYDSCLTRYLNLSH